ncbi:unnamed protein product, partial [Mesorhabditis belari]|uniref:SHSP domain-containing protein n=1 Tax=Mesorhabditis belari TaxID=2138241 RepID=A0AAF3FJL6_9BILA
MLSKRNDSSMTREEDDGRNVKLRFDMSNYKPEEVTVHAHDNHLRINAKHEENDPNHYIYRESKQEYHFPRGTHMDNVNANIGSDGTLTVEASRDRQDALGY